MRDFKIEGTPCGVEMIREVDMLVADDVLRDFHETMDALFKAALSPALDETELTTVRATLVEWEQRLA